MTNILNSTDFLPMAFEIYGACSGKFEDFLKKKVEAASEVNHVPYSYCVAELLEEAFFNYYSNL